MLSTLDEQLQQALALPSFIRMLGPNRDSVRTQSTLSQSRNSPAYSSNMSYFDDDSNPESHNCSDAEGPAPAATSADYSKTAEFDATELPTQGLVLSPMSSGCDTYQFASGCEGPSSVSSTSKRARTKSKKGKSQSRPNSVLTYRKTCNKCYDKKLKCVGGSPATGASCETCVAKGYECVFIHKQRPGPKMKGSETKLNSFFKSQLLQFSKDQKTDSRSGVAKLPPISCLLTRCSASPYESKSFQSRSVSEADENPPVFRAQGNVTYRMSPIPSCPTNRQALRVDHSRNSPFEGTMNLNFMQPAEATFHQPEGGFHPNLSLRKREVMGSNERVHRLLPVDPFNFKRMRMETESMMNVATGMQSYPSSRDRIESAGALMSLSSANKSGNMFYRN